MSFLSSSLDVNSFASPLVTGADVVRLYELAGESAAFKLLEYGKESLARAARCDGILAASVRAASSAGSANSYGSGSPLSRMVGTRLASINKVDSWRRKDGQDVVEQQSADKVGQYDDGYCYSKMFKKSCAQDKSRRVGPWPTLGKIVRLSSVHFKSMEDLERFRIVQMDKTRYHVAAGGSAGESFLDAVASYSYNKLDKLPDNCLGKAVASYTPVREKVKVLGNAQLGGQRHSRVKSRDAHVEALTLFAPFAVGGVPDAAAKERYKAALARAPELLRKSPELASIAIIAQSEVILQTLNSGVPSVVEYDLSRLDARRRDQIVQLSYMRYGNFTRNETKTGFTITPLTLQDEYSTENESRTAMKMFKIANVDVSYSLNYTKLTFS